MIASSIAGYDQFGRLLRIFDALLKETYEIFQKIPGGRRAHAALDLNHLESAGNASKSGLAGLIKKNEHARGEAQ